MKKQRFIITGASGFIGRHLTAALLKKGIELHLLMRDIAAGKKLFPAAAVYDSTATAEELKKICSEIKADCVIHLATRFSVSHSSDEISEMIDSNILLGTKLLEAAAPNSKAFLNIGTFWQHYEGKRYSPVNLYAATKQAFENIAHFYADNYPVNMATLCLNDTYGPDDTRKKIFNLWKDLCANPHKFLKMSPGSQLMDMLHINDVVSAISHCAELLINDRDKKFNKQSFYVSAAEKLTLKELAELFSRIADTSLDIRWGAKPYRNREVMIPRCYGKKLPGWKAEVKYAQGIADFLGIKELPDV